MNFELSEEQRMVRDTFARVCEERIKPVAAQIDEAHEFPRELFSELGKLGLFGLRTSIELIRSGTAPTSQQLSDQLAELSGLVELRTVLSTLFVSRSDVLKARSALLAVERLCHEHPQQAGVVGLEAELERVMSSAHPFNEMNTMAAIRSGWVSGSKKQLSDLERLLGTSGTLDAQRLDLAPTASPEEIRTAAITELGRWQRAAENQLTTHDLATAIRVAIRSLEGIVAAT